MVRISVVVAAAMLGLASAEQCSAPPRADGRCGPEFGNARCDRSSQYPCCSAYGWCGAGSTYCDKDLCGGGSAPTQAPAPAPPASGSCPNAPRPDGRCGPSFGNAGCDANSAYPCCSNWGWCGKGAGFCDVNVCNGGGTKPSPSSPPSGGVPIVVNLAVPSHVGVDCPGIQSRFPPGTYFCGSPKPPGANVWAPSCDESMTISYNGKSVTCVISFQATGVGITTGAYVEIVPDAYAVLTGATYGGQFHATCTGRCNVARN
ncbi:hypothetical protein ACHHYP_03934 [Achlya hypogyna]|uniref:Secreted protein n=1 Tax=Achlya hypogyna TaxID=1202772 RepID=A0A0A7CN91_ACHHY|nr:secreted protein [Achlya hypogyna]OQR92225.1 hypothetical protein ACHHYP_03934 [Achlya hypogyna]